jgi:hypothetical protein
LRASVRDAEPKVAVLHRQVKAPRLSYGCSDSSVRIATVDLARLLDELTR